MNKAKFALDLALTVFYILVTIKDIVDKKESWIWWAALAALATAFSVMTGTGAWK